MKYLFVGDLHGIHEAVDEAIKRPSDRIVFLGDIFDSFDRSIKDQFLTFNKIKDLIEQNKADCIGGNHEWSYLDFRMRCSGFEPATFLRRHEFEPTVRNLFKPYLLLGNILVTHAGLNGKYFNQDDIENLDAWYKEPNSPFWWIGRRRGGYDKTGGPLWCDFNSEFKPIKGITQIFGHTHGKGIREMNGNFCIDCIENDNFEFLEMEI